MSAVYAARRALADLESSPFFFCLSLVDQTCHLSQEETCHLSQVELCDLLYLRSAAVQGAIDALGKH